MIFVTSVEAPLSAPEEDFLREIRTQARQLFVVVKRWISSPLRNAMKYSATSAHAWSRRLELANFASTRFCPAGLVAKMNHDDSSLAQSGLAEFEAELTAFLAEEQGRAFLVAVLDRALHLLTDARLTVSPDDGVAANLERDHLRQSIEALRAPLLAGASLAVVHVASQPDPLDAQILERAIANNRSASRSSDERANLRSGTCPICAAQTQAMFDFFAHWQYSLASVPAAQRAFAAERGFCPAHTWQFPGNGVTSRDEYWICASH